MKAQRKGAELQLKLEQQISEEAKGWSELNKRHKGKVA